jgi:hypothetical protein
LQKGFSKHCKIYFIPALARLLWHDLVELFNELGWPEWIQISNVRPKESLQVSEKSFIKIRDKLIEHKLIIYVKGSKNIPNRYKLNLDIDFIYRAQFYSQSDSTNGSISSVQSSAKSSDINKLKQNKTK